MGDRNSSVLIRAFPTADALAQVTEGLATSQSLRTDQGISDVELYIADLTDWASQSLRTDQGISDKADKLIVSTEYQSQSLRTDQGISDVVEVAAVLLRRGGGVAIPPY